MTKIETPGSALALPDPHRNPLTWHAVLLPGFVVHDGDTLTHCTLDLGWHQARLGDAVRLTSSLGPINAPEVTGNEKPAGILVRNAVAQWLAEAGRVWLRSRAIDARGNHAEDSRGRTVAEVWVTQNQQDHELGAWLIEHRLVKFCEPSGKRVFFTAAELDDIVARLQEPKP